MTGTPLDAVLQPARRWWWVGAGVVVVALLLTWLTMPDRSDEEQFGADVSAFSATHLLIRDNSAPAQMSFDLIMLLSRQGELVNRVVEQMGGAVGAEAVAQVQVFADPVTETISVTAVRPDPDEATALADVYAEELLRFLAERSGQTIENDYRRVSERLDELQASVEDLEASIAELPEGDAERLLLEADLGALLAEFGELRTQQRALEAQRQTLAAGFETLERPVPVPAEAEEATLALPTRPALRYAMALVLGVLFGIGLIIGIDRLDTRVRGRREAESAFGLPVIAEVPRRSRRHLRAHPLPTFDDPGGVTAEVLRALRLSVSLAPTWQLAPLSTRVDGAVGGKEPVKLESEPRSIVITSTLTGEGKSTLAANLAVSIAEGGRRVLVVDCDFRRPAVGTILDVQPGLGLRELAKVGERPLRDLAAATVVPNVAMVRSGSRGVTPPWFMREARELLEWCLDVADVVIFDTGPITLTNEASALLPLVDTSLLVARAGKVTNEQARGTIEQITQVSGRVSGIVLVGSSGSRRYGYGYYRHDEKTDRGTGPGEVPSQRPGTRLSGGSLWDSNRSPHEPNGQPSGSQRGGSVDVGDREAWPQT